MWGMYHVIYSTAPDPLVSIIIPNKDHIDDLDKCVQSIYATSTYQNFEFIVVENNSTDPATFAYYERMQKKHPTSRWSPGPRALTTPPSTTSASRAPRATISCF